MTKGRLEFNQGDIFLDFFSVTKHLGNKVDTIT